MRPMRYPKTSWRNPKFPENDSEGVPITVSVLVSAETIEQIANSENVSVLAVPDIVSREEPRA